MMVEKPLHMGERAYISGMLWYVDCGNKDLYFKPHFLTETINVQTIVLNINRRLVSRIIIHQCFTARFIQSLQIRLTPWDIS